MLPAWMFDEKRCAAMSLQADPVTSFDALCELRRLLDQELERVARASDAIERQTHTTVEPRRASADGTTVEGAAERHEGAGPRVGRANAPGTRRLVGGRRSR